MYQGYLEDYPRIVVGFSLESSMSQTSSSENPISRMPVCKKEGATPHPPMINPNTLVWNEHDISFGFHFQHLHHVISWLRESKTTKNKFLNNSFDFDIVCFLHQGILDKPPNTIQMLIYPHMYTLTYGKIINIQTNEPYGGKLVQANAQNSNLSTSIIFEFQNYY